MQRGTNHREESRESISQKMKRKHAVQRAALEFGVALTKALQAPDDAAANYAANLAYERFEALRADTPLTDAIAKALRRRPTPKQVTKSVDATPDLSGYGITERNRAHKHPVRKSKEKVLNDGVPNAPVRRLNDGGKLYPPEGKS